MAGESARDQCNKEGCSGCKNCNDSDFSYEQHVKTNSVKYKVLIDDKVKEYDNLDKAVETVVRVSSKLTVSALLAANAGNDDMRDKCNKTRDSIRMEIVNG